MSAKCSPTKSMTTTSPLSIYYHTPETALETKQPYPQAPTTLGMVTSGATQSTTSTLSANRVSKATKGPYTVTVTLGPITTSLVSIPNQTATTTTPSLCTTRVDREPPSDGTTEKKQPYAVGPTMSMVTSEATPSTTSTLPEILFSTLDGRKLTSQQCEEIMVPIRAEIVEAREKFWDLLPYSKILAELFLCPIVGHELWKTEVETYYTIGRASTDQVSFLILHALPKMPHANFVASIDYLASRPGFANCSHWNPGWGNCELHNFMNFEKDMLGTKNPAPSGIAPIAKKYREQQAKLLLQPEKVTLPKGGECNEVTIFPEQWTSNYTLDNKPEQDKEMWDAFWPQICSLKGPLPLHIVIQTTWRTRQESSKFIARIQAEAKKKGIFVRMVSIDTM